ncbi:MAG: protein tyrosine phosphatase [Isosphaeraceae bacterium]
MDTPRASRTRTFGIVVDWPWLLLLGLGITAGGYLLVGENDLDGEFPSVIRPTFSAYPPAAYRLAEPGDTLDRVGVYLAAGAAVVGAVAALRGGRANARRWLGLVAVSLGAFWYSANPSPTFDGWHGWNFDALANPEAPRSLRLALGAWAASLALVAAWGGRAAVASLVSSSSRVAGLTVLAIAMTALRLAEWPNPEPVGYWPRWAWVIGLAAGAVVVGRLARQAARERARVNPPRRSIRLATLGLMALGWVGMTTLGLDLVWRHRPLERFRTIEPGKIYISAIPTYEGLKVAHARHKFKTIINLFPEHPPLRSPLFDDEIRFAREHGIRLIENPRVEERPGDFLDETLRVAQDPSAWPLLVHCHACMDRTPAWMGMYRFLVQGQPLAEVFREIERHRGCRPKASVFLLYTQLLPSRSAGRFDADPTGALLRQVSGDGPRVFEFAPPSDLGGPRIGAKPRAGAVE